jgi:hypothetical protein
MAFLSRGAKKPRSLFEALSPHVMASAEHDKGHAEFSGFRE